MRDTAVQCDLVTAAPTAAPTDEPSPSPTAEPTDYPTARPTNQPTFTPYVIDSCSLEITSDSAAAVVVTDIRFERSGGQTQAVSYSYTINDGAYVDMSPCFGGTNCGAETCVCNSVYLSGYGPEVFVPLTGNGAVEFKIYPLSQGAYGTSALCTIVSEAPTDAPTDVPSPSPTTEPSPAPTAEPSPAPTEVPTPGPTYQDMTVDCTFQLDPFGSDAQINHFVVTFDEPTFTEPATPPLSEVTYKVKYHKSGTDTVTVDSASTAAVESDAACCGTAAGIDVTLSGSQVLDTDDDLPNYYVAVTLVHDGEDIPGSPNVCSQVSPAPTRAPTTESPTASPTWADPSACFDMTEISTIHSCEITTDGIYQCKMNVGEDHSYKVTLTTSSGWEYDLLVDWELSYVDPYDSDPSKNLANADDFESTSDTPLAISASDGEDNLEIECAEVTKSSDEFAWLVLSSCSLDMTTVGSSDTEAAVYGCTVCSDNTIELKIDASTAPAPLTQTSLGDLPDWIWYPIAGGILLIALFSWLGWRYYKKRQFAEALTEVKKAELADAQDYDDPIAFGGCGDDVTVNPIATGGLTSIPTEGDFIDQHLEAERRNMETAKVDTTTEVYKQNFGPVQTAKRS